ncbi:hypothetical protein LOTGIDRAFT_111585 [Lottia gigantea]|uniref:GDNF/GAS1 domain-containing protein n=1 Tax=Lottia gigantea TaxID=225164 RepID=V4B1P8_LOTGI|nr:hypothetical protein LOTGIDRAFT_111585 [Lottia gigantea]ESP01246.1 hypothetical protein LOTGIDRAFT_111585 [Lottia gigantea]
MHVQRLVFGICALAGYIYCDIAIELCDTVRLSCSARDGCQMALTNFFVGCNDVIYGKGNKCTTKCEHALISLLSTEDKAGLAFMNCNCSGNALCEERKARVEVCTRVVLKSMTHLENKDHSISCNLAQWICEADTACLTALDYYAQHCSKLLLADKCTSRCNNSLQILYRQKNAKKLPNCYCDGKEEYDCYKLKYNTEKYCFHKEPNIPYVDNRSRKPSHSSHKNSGRKGNDL